MKKPVLITGGAKGIGRAIAEIFAKNHYPVAINYHRSEEAAKALLADLEAQGCRAMILQGDVTQGDQVKEMVKTVEQAFGPIEILVNNAGIAQGKLFTGLTEEEWDRMMAVHLKGMFHCCQAVIPPMVSMKRGKIINISSIWGMVGASCEVHYATAKAGMIGFTKALAKELGPSQIQVNCVAPGIIETDMISDLDEASREYLKEQTPLMRFGTPREVASLVYYLASDEADFITGQVFSPNGGFVI